MRLSRKKNLYSVMRKCFIVIYHYIALYYVVCDILFLIFYAIALHYFILSCYYTILIEVVCLILENKKQKQKANSSNIFVYGRLRLMRSCMRFYTTASIFFFSGFYDKALYC